MNERKYPPVKFDKVGYAVPGGDVIHDQGYLWIGDDVKGCYTHTTSLNSLRALRDLCAALVKAREVKYAKDKKRRLAKRRAGNGS